MQHVLRKGEGNRPGPAGLCDVVSPGQELRYAFGGRDFRSPFGDRIEESLEIHLLKGIAMGVVPRDLSDQQKHGCRVMPCDVNPACRVRCAGAAGHNGNTRFSRDLCSGLRHHCGTSLVPADDVPDRTPVQPVKQRQETLAGDGEHPAAPMNHQLIGEDLSSVTDLHPVSPIEGFRRSLLRNREGFQGNRCNTPIRPVVNPKMLQLSWGRWIPAHQWPGTGTPFSLRLTGPS